MITNEGAWLAARGFPSRFDGVMHYRRLGRALVALLRVAEYARELTRAEDAIVAERRHAAREAHEWHRLYEKATNRAVQAEDLLLELADKAPDTARLLGLQDELQKRDDKLREVMESHEIWHERCLALESKLKIEEIAT